jgi:hypothetical protein
MTHLLERLEESPPRTGSAVAFYFHPSFPVQGEESDLSPTGATFTGRVHLLTHSSRRVRRFM